MRPTRVSLPVQQADGMDEVIIPSDYKRSGAPLLDTLQTKVVIVAKSLRCLHPEAQLVKRPTSVNPPLA
eukprot:1952514-Amphidinium_carterae.1